MENLAGVDAAEATAKCAMELVAAGIVPKMIDEGPGEVKSRIGGSMNVRGYEFTFRRAWVYWTVNVSPPIPCDIARKINDAPYIGDGGKYSGQPRRLGSVARVDGYAGGKEPDEGGVVGYLIDTQRGLFDFVEVIKTEFARLTDDEIIALKARRLAVKTDAMVASIERAQGAGLRNSLRRLLRDGYGDCDRSDPRIIAFLAGEGEV